MVVGEVKQEQFFNIDGFLPQAFTAALENFGLKLYFPKRSKSPKFSCYGKLSWWYQKFSVTICMNGSIR